MKRSVVVGIAVGIILAIALATGSCVPTDEFAPKQRDQIEKYIGDVAYRITSDSAYVVLAGNKLVADGEQRPDRVGASNGDRVNFDVEAYSFNSGPSSKPYYTTKRYLAEQLSTELDTSWWPFEPFDVTLGRGEILNSLEEALDGSIAGDSLLVYMTSSIAYGEDGMGAVPANTAVMMILTVNEVVE